MTGSIKIFGLEEIKNIISDKVTLDAYCISIGDPGINILKSIPDCFTNYLRLEFHDIHEPNEIESIMPSENNIIQLIGFIRNNKKNNLPYFIHCNQGVGRSPAIAMIILKILDYSNADIKRILNKRRPQALPNRVLISLADKILKSNLSEINSIIRKERIATFDDTQKELFIDELSN